MSKQTATHAHPSGSFWARNRKSGGYLLRKTVRRKGYQLIRFLLLFFLFYKLCLLSDHVPESSSHDYENGNQNNHTNDEFPVSFFFLQVFNSFLLV